MLHPIAARLLTAKESRELLTAHVEGRNTDGFIVRVFDTWNAYLPIGESGLSSDTQHPGHNRLVGTTITVVVQSVLLVGPLIKIIVSRRAANLELVKRHQQARDQAATLQVGTVVPVVVRNHFDWGTYASTGNLLATIARKDLGWGRSPFALPAGHTLPALITEIDPEQHRIRASIRDATPDPFLTAPERYPIGYTGPATIKTLAGYGLFVDFEPGVSALLHRHELSSMPSETDFAAHFILGATLNVTVITFDEERRRIAVRLA